MAIVPYPPGSTMGRMPSSPYVICLGDAERAELESLSRRASAPFRLVLRSRIVLLAAAGTANRVIAERLGICEDTARKWRRRYCGQGIEGLADAPRPGRPRVFPARVVAGVKALACEMPASSGTPLARWTCPELARHAAASGIAPAPSASTVRRWLADDALKPWQHRSWIFPRDPHFALKASRVLDLYQREWEGQPLGGDEYVLSADEKPGVQARMRIHLPLPPGPGRAMRAESEYHRYGTLAYLAAYDVHRAQVYGRLRTQDRYRLLHEPGHPGHDPRALRRRETRLLGCRQRLLPPREEGHRRVSVGLLPSRPARSLTGQALRSLYRSPSRQSSQGVDSSGSALGS